MLPLTGPKFTEQLAQIARLAEKNFARDKNLTTVWFVFPASGGPEIIAVPEGSARTALPEVRDAVARTRAVACALVTEAWAAPNDETTRARGASNNPQRQELAILCGLFPTEGATVGHQWRIVRPPGRDPYLRAVPSDEPTMFAPLLAEALGLSDGAFLDDLPR